MNSKPWNHNKATMQHTQARTWFTNPRSNLNMIRLSKTKLKTKPRLGDIHNSATQQQNYSKIKPKFDYRKQYNTRQTRIKQSSTRQKTTTWNSELLKAKHRNGTQYRTRTKHKKSNDSEAGETHTATRTWLVKTQNSARNKHYSYSQEIELSHSNSELGKIELNSRHGKTQQATAKQTKGNNHRLQTDSTETQLKRLNRTDSV